MNLKSFKVNLEEDFSIIDFKNTKIKVFKHISTEAKERMISSILAASLEENCFNPFKIEVFTNVAIIDMYTDIELVRDTESDDYLNDYEIYDTIMDSGLIDAVISAMKDEYDSLIDMINEVVAAKESELQSVAYGVIQMLNALSQNLTTMAETVNTFDPDKYQAVMDFAKAANGNRELPPQE